MLIETTEAVDIVAHEDVKEVAPGLFVSPDGSRVIVVNTDTGKEALVITR